MTEPNLQTRLDAVFGGLQSGATPSFWQPTTRQVFRGDALCEADASSDEEYEKKLRNEAVAGGEVFM
jgi:hypothetical protein